MILFVSSRVDSQSLFADTADAITKCVDGESMYARTHDMKNIHKGRPLFSFLEIKKSAGDEWKRTRGVGFDRSQSEYCDSIQFWNSQFFQCRHANRKMCPEQKFPFVMQSKVCDFHRKLLKVIYLRNRLCNNHSAGGKVLI